MPPVFPGRRFRRRGEQLRRSPPGPPRQGGRRAGPGAAPGGRLALTTWDTPDRVRLQGMFLEAFAAAGAPRCRPSSAAIPPFPVCRRGRSQRAPRRRRAHRRPGTHRRVRPRGGVAKRAVGWGCWAAPHGPRRSCVANPTTSRPGPARHSIGRSRSTAAATTSSCPLGQAGRRPETDGRLTDKYVHLRHSFSPGRRFKRLVVRRARSRSTSRPPLDLSEPATRR
jgi:hypothetical protein